MEGEDDDETAVLFVNTPVNDGYSSSVYSTDADEDDENRKCLTIDEAVETAGFGRFHFYMVIIFGWANSADAIEMLAISFILPQASCELNATDTELGLLTAMGFAGMMLGSFVWGSLADAKGRIPALILCQACNGLFTIASALSQSLWFLILMRFFSGFGVGGTSPLVYTYVVELLPKKNRGRMTAILSCSFMVGQVAIAGMAWLILPHAEWTWTSNGFTFNSWRIFMLVSAFPVSTSCLLFMTFPESPRYLAQVNKISEAKAVIRYAYIMNRNQLPYDDNYNIKRITLHGNTGSGFRNAIKKVARNTWDLVALPELRPKFLYSSIILFSLSFSYYGLTMWFPTLFERMEDSNATSVCAAPLPAGNKTKCDLSDRQQVYFDTFLQAASNLPGHLTYLLLIESVGRKLLIGITMLLTAVTVFFIWFVSSRTGSVVISCVFAAITIISWDAISLVTAEIFPTEIRSTAGGVQSALFIRVPAILANLVIGALLATHCAVPILLTAGLLVVGAIVTYKLPNTTNVAIN